MIFMGTGYGLFQQKVNVLGLGVVNARHADHKALDAALNLRDLVLVQGVYRLLLQPTQILLLFVQFLF